MLHTEPVEPPGRTVKIVEEGEPQFKELPFSSLSPCGGWPGGGKATGSQGACGSARSRTAPSEHDRVPRPGDSLSKFRGFSAATGSGILRSGSASRAGATSCRSRRWASRPAGRHRGGPESALEQPRALFASCGDAITIVLAATWFSPIPRSSFDDRSPARFRTHPPRCRFFRRRCRGRSRRREEGRAVGSRSRW